MVRPPGGLNRTKRTTWVVAASLCMSLVFSAIAAASEIGAAVVVVNHVTGALGSEKPPMVLHAGIDVFQDEIVRAGDNSAARVIFQDKTTLEIAPSSEIVLDRFVFDPDPSLSKVAVSVVAGVARFTTGSLPKADYTILTPGATLAVRGTVLDIHVDAGGGTFVFVEEGVVLFTSGGQTVTINAGQSSFAQVGGTPSGPTTTPFPSGLINQLFTLLQQAAATGGPPTTPTNPPGNSPPNATPNTTPSNTPTNCVTPSAPTPNGCR
jgi:hypothetical protein